MTQDCQHLANILARIATAVKDHGPHPRYNQQVEQRHRREWPTLWLTIDRAVKAGESYRSGMVYQTILCEDCGMRVGIDVDCDNPCHTHKPIVKTVDANGAPLSQLEVAEAKIRAYEDMLAAEKRRTAEAEVMAQYLRKVIQTYVQAEHDYTITQSDYFTPEYTNELQDVHNRWCEAWDNLTKELYEHE